MGWQPSQTYSWHATCCYAGHDWRSDMPIRGKHHPKWAGLSAVTARKDEVKLMDAQSTLKWFRQDKKQLQALCAGMLSRDSFNTQKISIMLQPINMKA